MPLVATRGGASASALGWSSAPQAEELGGMVLLAPTSIAYTGTSASIGTNGSVEFAACSVLELRGIFSADYDNYLIAIRTSSNGTIASIDGRLMSGTTPASGTNYTRQYFYADGSTVAAYRDPSPNYTRVHQNYNQGQAGTTLHLYGPYLTQPTAMRTVRVDNASYAFLTDEATTHSLSTSYDGFYFYTPANTVTGLVSVYGLVGA